jgi:hypothetical protein
MTLLILLSGITPLLASIVAVIPDNPPTLKWAVAGAAIATGIVLSIRDICNDDHRWRVFWASYVALMCMRRKYKCERGRLRGDINKHYDLIDNVYTELEKYIREESERTIVSILKSASSVEVNAKRAASHPTRAI